MKNQNSLQDRLDRMIDDMSICVICGKRSIIEVATCNNVPFYSCITEGCSREAQLLVKMDDGEFVDYYKIYETLSEIVKNGKTDDNKGES